MAPRGGVVQGLKGRDVRVNQLRRVSHTRCAPPVRAHVREVDTSGGVVLTMEVSPGETLHETSAGDCYLRVGDATMKLSGSQREELAYDRGAAQYEARAMPGLPWEDLDADRVEELRQALGARPKATKALLSARSLLTRRGEVTVAAYLLLASRPGAAAACRSASDALPGHEARDRGATERGGRRRPAARGAAVGGHPSGRGGDR